MHSQQHKAVRVGSVWTPQLLSPWLDISFIFKCSRNKVNTNQNMNLTCISADITSSLVIQVCCYKVRPMGMGWKLIVWHLSTAVSLCGVTHARIHGQYMVNKPGFDWQVTFHYRKKSLRHSANPNRQDTHYVTARTLCRQTDRQDGETLLQDF